MPSHQLVSITPGETALTRIGASSAASGGTMAAIAPLAAARPAVPGLAERADAALMNVTDADRLRCGAAACRIRTWAKNFPSNAVCRSFSSRVTSGPIATAPGLSASTRWSTVSPSPKNEATASGSVASRARVCTGWPMRDAAASSRSLVRPVITTSSPAAANARAVASPMPWVPPMTYTCCPTCASVIENYRLDKHFIETRSLVKLLCCRHGGGGEGREPGTHGGAAETGGPRGDPGRDRATAAGRRPGRPDRRRDRPDRRGGPADDLPVVAVQGRDAGRGHVPAGGGGGAAARLGVVRGRPDRVLDRQLPRPGRSGSGPRGP